MLSLASFQNHILENQSKIKAILLVFAIFSIISPFSGYLELHSNLISYFKSNLLVIKQFPINLNPIFIILEFLMYELNGLIGFLFPKLWGPNNYFFMRFMLKLPLFVFFILIPFLVEKIVLLELKDEHLASHAFYLQMFNLPLMYVTFFLGTPESIELFFILLQWYYLIQWKNDGTLNGNWFLGIFLSGFVFSIAVSFSYNLILVAVVFLSFMKMKQVLVYICSVVFTNLLILAPIYLLNVSSITFPIQYYFGIQNVITFFKIDYIAIFILILEIILIVIVFKFTNLRYFDQLLILSLLLVILTVNLSINDFIIVIQLFVLGMITNFNFNTHYRFRSLIIDDVPSGSFYVPVVLIYIATILYLFFVFRISDIIYLKIIVLGPIGVVNRMFWNLNFLVEFNIVFYIIFSFLLLVSSILTIKKRKIFNIDENH